MLASTFQSYSHLTCLFYFALRNSLFVNHGRVKRECSIYCWFNCSGEYTDARALIGRRLLHISPKSPRAKLLWRGDHDRSAKFL